MEDILAPFVSQKKKSVFFWHGMCYQTQYGHHQDFLEPLIVLCFEAQTLQNKVLSNQNKGHLGCRYFPENDGFQ